MSYTKSLNLLSPLFQLRASPKLGAKTKKKKTTSLSAKLNNSADPQLNLSVLRFTFEFLGWMSHTYPDGSDTGLDLFCFFRTEALGLSLASFSIALPYLGKFLKGATPMDQTSIPEGCEQNVSDTQKEDLAWTTYVLLRNTNTISVIISVRDELRVCGYWSIPNDVSKTNVLDWFEKQIFSIGLSDVKGKTCTFLKLKIQDFGKWYLTGLALSLYNQFWAEVTMGLKRQKDLYGWLQV